jgi:hypothetical protein
MTASQVRARQAAPAHLSLASLARLLRVELRRNPWPWMVPLLVALFLFDPYRTAMGYPPIWDLRASVIPNKLLPDFVAFVGGVSAWAGSRDGRRKTLDMVTATARSAWARRGVTLAATACWVLAVYLVFVAVLYVVFARQATWGGPPWWPVVVTAAALVALCAAGFAVGEHFPGRFTPPLAALGAVFVSLVAFQNAVGKTGGFWLLSPSASVPNLDIGVFYHYLPDLPITQVMFLAGVTAVAVGLLGLSSAADGGPPVRRAAVAVIVVGLAAAGSAVGLATTARLTPSGVVIPALHDAASDRPVPYTPVCTRSAVPICVHPAFRASLPVVAAAVGPVLREIAGLPGAPARVTETAVNGIGGGYATLGGAPPVFGVPLTELPGSFGTDTARFNPDTRNLFVTAFVTGHPGVLHGTVGTPAQQAVEITLLRGAGVGLNPRLPTGPQGGPHQGAPPRGSAAAKQLAQIAAAVGRFGALPASARHAWLATHLAALRAGHVTLAQLP